MKDAGGKTMRAYLDVSEEWVRPAKRSPDGAEAEVQETRTAADIQRAEHERFLARHSELRRFCEHTFADIHRDFSDLNDLLALTDAGGRLICLHCPHELLAVAIRDMGLRCGVTLTESNCGSNAVTLALHYGEAMITMRPGRQCGPFGNRATVAVPLLGSDQNVAGCIAIFNADEGALGQKLLLAKFIAREISRVHLPSTTGLTAATPLSPRSVANDAAECRMDKVAVSPPPDLMERRRGDRRRMPHVAVASVNLTRRQLQVLQLFAQGKGYKEIARDIGITSYKTVEEHLDAVREKLQVAHRRECIQKAISLGLL